MRKLCRNLFLIATAAAISGCAPGEGFPIGPIPFTVPIGSGEFDPQDFGVIPGVSGTVESEVSLCDALDSVDLDQLIENAVGEMLAPFLEITDLILVDARVAAVEGDFSTVTDVQLFFQPAPADGQSGDPVFLGSAHSEQGFGTQVSIEFENLIDLLTILEEREANPEGECPSFLVQVTGTPPESRVVWSGEVTVNVSGVVRLPG